MTVYFAQSGAYVKVGYTAGDPETRIKGLQTGNPEDIRLIHSMPGGLSTERRIQSILSDRHHRGEWFIGPIEDILAELGLFDLFGDMPASPVDYSGPGLCFDWVPLRGFPTMVGRPLSRPFVDVTRASATYCNGVAYSIPLCTGRLYVCPPYASSTRSRLEF